jgi:hypothetical protein
MANVKVLYRYSVTGTGHFPMDMLRYDAAWPSNTDDCFGITDAFNEREPGTRSKPRTVKLVSIRKPTIGRWSSFLWSVSDVQEVKL